MASRFMKLFWNQDAISEANRKYRERMAEIDEHNTEVKAAIADARANNTAEFKRELAENNARLAEAWKR